MVLGQFCQSQSQSQSQSRTESICELFRSSSHTQMAQIDVSGDGGVMKLLQKEGTGAPVSTTSRIKCISQHCPAGAGRSRQDIPFLHTTQERSRMVSYSTRVLASHTAPSTVSISISTRVRSSRAGMWYSNAPVFQSSHVVSTAVCLGRVSVQ